VRPGGYVSVFKVRILEILCPATVRCEVTPPNQALAIGAPQFSAYSRLYAIGLASLSQLRSDDERVCAVRELRRLSPFHMEKV
jgi:hypothetical protein